MDEVKIITYTHQYKDQFKTLNYEWLNKYFEIEPMDEQILSHPQKIIDDGGQIFLALINDEAVGTAAVIKMDETTFELAKMAVTEIQQGKSIGKKLGIAAISYAKGEKIKSIFLESNSKLIPAINLYKKLGFKVLPGERSSHYKRCDINMKLDL